MPYLGYYPAVILPYILQLSLSLGYPSEKTISDRIISVYESYLICKEQDWRFRLFYELMIEQDI